MIVLDLWKLSDPTHSIYASYGPRERCEEWRSRITWTDPARFTIERVPHCGCCGGVMASVGGTARSLTTSGSGATRCDKHHGRDPCAIEGCRRTRAAPICSSGIAKGEPYHADDQTLCAEHWRRLVPPRSRIRRTYHAYWRQAKLHGWQYKGRNGCSARRDWRFRRFWDALIAQARRRATEGHIDEAAIHRFFGWEEAA